MSLARVVSMNSVKVVAVVTEFSDFEISDLKVSKCGGGL